MLATTVLGSGIAALDATVVNVALPTIGRDFDTGLSSLQWTVTAYTLSLAALLLLGGSLGDRYGRRRIFVIGVVWFAAASSLCGAAPDAPTLIAARALQGIGAALLTPGSLAILEASFAPGDRAKAIGAWSGLGGVAAALGPLLGGYLIDAVSWRLIFLINLPLAAVVVWAAVRYVPESRDPGRTGRPDAAGAALVALGLAGVTYALVEAPGRGAASPTVLAAAAIGSVALVAFLVVEARLPSPMLPLGVFSDRTFSGANLATFAVYAALAGALFLLPIQLQQVLGYSSLESGTALLPVTVTLLLLSARAGALASRIGPRLPMTVGPLLAAVGLAMLVRVGAGRGYVDAVLPAVVVFGLGLALTVAPLTSTVLAAAPSEHAGVASAVNNGVARTAALLAVAILPVAAGITGDTYLDADAFSAGFRSAVLISAALCALGGLISAVSMPGAPPSGAVGPGAAGPLHVVTRGSSCPLDAPPLRGAVTDALATT